MISDFYKLHIRVGIGIPKYRKYREIPKFNSIEYRKCSIPNFQYYWILKKFQYWSSIIPKFSALLPQIPNLQMSWILRKKNSKKNFFFFLVFFFKNSQYSWVFSIFFGIFRYFSGFNIENNWYWKKKGKKKIRNFFETFFSRKF